MSAAKFITFEGVDGAGKSTHLEWFADTLRKCGIDVLVTLANIQGDNSMGESRLSSIARRYIAAAPLALYRWQ